MRCLLVCAGYAPCGAPGNTLPPAVVVPVGSAPKPGAGRSPTKGHPFTPRTIVITGASDGIGAAAARTLARAGDQVVVVGRSEEKTRAIAKELDADYFVSDFSELA